MSSTLDFPDFWNARACGAFGMKNQESVPFAP